MTFVGKEKAQKILYDTYNFARPSRPKKFKPLKALKKIIKNFIKPKPYEAKVYSRVQLRAEMVKQREIYAKRVLDVYLKEGTLDKTGAKLKLSRERIRQIIGKFPEYKEFKEKRDAPYLYEYTCSWCQEDHAVIATKGSVKPRFCSKECQVKARIHVSPTSRLRPIEEKRKYYCERMKAYVPKLKARLGDEYKERIRKYNEKARRSGRAKLSRDKREKMLRQMAKEVVSELPSPIAPGDVSSTQLSHISSREGECGHVILPRRGWVCGEKKPCKWHGTK